MFHSIYLEAGLLVAAAVAAVPIRYRLRLRRSRRPQHLVLRDQPLRPHHPQPDPAKPQPGKEQPKKEEPKKEEPKKGGSEPQAADITPRAVIGQFNYLTNCSWGPGQFWGEITLAEDIPASPSGSPQTFVLPIEGIAPFDRLANVKLTFFGLTLPPNWTVAQFSDYQRTTGASFPYVSGSNPDAMYPINFSLLAPDANSPAQVRLTPNGPPADFGGKPWPKGTRVLIFSLTGI